MAEYSIHISTAWIKVEVVPWLIQKSPAQRNKGHHTRAYSTDRFPSMPGALFNGRRARGPCSGPKLGSPVQGLLEGGTKQTGRSSGFGVGTDLSFPSHHGMFHAVSPFNK